MIKPQLISYLRQTINVIFRQNGADAGLYLITKLVLWVAKIIFNAEGQ